MNKMTHFINFGWEGWPDEKSLARYFLTPDGRNELFSSTNDSWGLKIEGIEGTDHLPQGGGRVDVNLMIQLHRDLGALLVYHKWGNGQSVGYLSKGNLSQLRHLIQTAHDDLMPVGLFIPFEAAWKAIKKFMERDAALPDCIIWIESKDLPPNTFPGPVMGPNAFRLP